MAVMWQLAAVHFGKQTLLCGVVLRRAPFTYDKKLSPWKHMLKISSTYAISVCRHFALDIYVNGKSVRVITGKDGGFSTLVNFPVEGELHANAVEDGKPVAIIQSYPVVFTNTDGPYDVISDIDDTIVHSFSTDFFKRIRTLAFKHPRKRKVIGFTRQLFEIAEAAGARVFYISKSESNLFALLTSFINHHNLPEGRLFLTPYRSLGGLFRRKPGRDHKLKNIRFILEHSPGKKFVLIGDDSQQDMDVYTRIAESFPGRIQRIYIRRTRHLVSKRQQKHWDRLQQLCPGAVYFSDNDQLTNELKPAV